MDRKLYCLGTYRDEGYKEYTCQFRDTCYHYPPMRWLADNYRLTETFGDGTVGEIKPPAMPPPPNPKRPYTGEPICKCPHYLPIGTGEKKERPKTPFD